MDYFINEEKAKEVIERVRKNKIEFVDMQFTDIGGTLKRKGISAKDFESAIYKGSFFDGSSIQGYARIHESDMILIPDLGTYVEMPNKKARVICDVYTPDGKPFEGYPRFILKRTLEKMKKSLGPDSAFYVAPELEFYLLDNRNENLALHDSAGYFDAAPKDLAESIRDECIKFMKKIGIKVEAEHHEVGPGQHEIDIVYGDALKLGDQTITYKMIVQGVAERNKLLATFMPKPFEDKPGSGMHCHINIVKEKNGKKYGNLFFDKNSEREDNLSDYALYSIGGIMKHAKGSCAIWCPTINSYKRLGKSEAPKYIMFGHTNRSALIRIPAIRKEDYNSIRFELRCPDPSGNPYLTYAVILADMLDGINNKISPPKEVEKDMFHASHKEIETLPNSLEEALRELVKDDVVKEALGEHCLDEFIRLKNAELRDFNSHVTNWERKRYLHV